MENSNLLLRIYKDVTGEELIVAERENRIVMQKIVFLFSELGLTIGNYKFAWDKYGPFSQSLHNDISTISETDVPYSGEFSESVQNIILFVRELLNKSVGTTYSLRNWIEAIASLLFLKRYVYPSYDWEEINQQLVVLKEHLSNREDNEKAIESCKLILAYNN